MLVANEWTLNDANEWYHIYYFLISLTPGTPNLQTVYFKKEIIDDEMF